MEKAKDLEDLIKCIADEQTVCDCAYYDIDTLEYEGHRRDDMGLRGVFRSDRRGNSQIT